MNTMKNKFSCYVQCNGYNIGAIKRSIYSIFPFDKIDKIH